MKTAIKALIGFDNQGVEAPSTNLGPVHMAFVRANLAIFPWAT